MKRGLAPSIMDYAKIQSKQVSGISAILCAAKIGTAPESGRDGQPWPCRRPRASKATNSPAIARRNPTFRRVIQSALYVRASSRGAAVTFSHPFGGYLAGESTESQRLVSVL
jgi:hypothetical protein